MQKDFHYYATYCAAYLAGYSHQEALQIAYSAQFVDLCSRTLLNKLRAPAEAATTQLQLELMDARTDQTGLQDITRIWSSFHFLPGDLNAERKKCSKRYRNKYRLICNPNSELVIDTVENARNKGLQATGIAMHVLADTWAHRYFAGTPSLVINNTNYYFYELLGEDERIINFRHSATAEDDLENSIYINSLYQTNENSIMNLGHGRAGHLPDYSFIRYKYLPSWGDYQEIIKDNPKDYICAFAQMVYALKCLKNGEKFKNDVYDIASVGPNLKRLKGIITRRQTDGSEDWKALGESLSHKQIEDFDLEKYQAEYINADRGSKSDTFIGRFINAAIAHKSMVTLAIYKSGNKLAGRAVARQRKEDRT